MADGLSPAGISHVDDWRLISSRSVVPTMVIDSTTLSIVDLNDAVRALLPALAPGTGKLTLLDLSDPDHSGRLQNAISECASRSGTTRFLRHRFVGRGTPDVLTEMAVTGCGAASDGRNLVLIQMRDASADASLAVFVRLIADNPDGDTLVRALVSGPLAHLGIQLATVNVVDRSGRRIIQLGTYGMDAESVRLYTVTPLDHTHPGGSAVLNHETVRSSIRSLEEGFPIVRAEARRQPWFETGEIMAMPVISRGTVVGSLFLMADQPLPRSWAFHESLGTVVQSLAPWMLLHPQDDNASSAPVPKKSPLSITDRERTILRLARGGLTNAEIADDLGYSEATIRADLGRLGRMLGVRGRREILRRVEELGL